VNKFRALAALLLFSAAAGWGVDFEWTNSSGDNCWNNPANWSPPTANRFPGYDLSGTGGPFGGADTAIFNSTATVTLYAESSNQGIGHVKIQLNNSSSLTLKNASPAPGLAEIKLSALEVSSNSSSWATIQGTFEFPHQFEAIFSGSSESLSIKSETAGAFTFTGTGTGISSSGPITIEAAGDMTLAGAIEASGTGDIILEADKKITVNDAIKITGTGDIELSAEEIEINDAITGTGAVSLTMTAGGITQAGSGAITAADLQLISVNGPVNLGGAVNMVDNLAVAGSGSAAVQGNVSFRNGKALTVGISTEGIKATGTVNLTTTAGGISGSGAITAAALTVTAVGAVVLNNPANSVSGLDATGNGIQFKNTGILDITKIASGAAVSVEAGGNVTLTTSGGGISSVGAIIIDAGGAIAINNIVINTGTGSIILTANDMDITSSITANAGTGLVKLLNKNPGRPIHLGGTSTGSFLSLSASDIDQIKAGVLEIGDRATSGAITIDGAINLTTITDLVINSKKEILVNSNVSISTGNVALTTEAAISGTGKITATTLTIDAGGKVDLDTAPNSVGTLKVTGSSGVEFDNGKGLIITEITSSDAVAVKTNGTIAVNGALTTSPASNVNLKTTAGGAIGGTGKITATALTIDAAGAADLSGTAHAVTALEARNSSGLAFVNTGELDITGISGSGAITVEAGGAITVSGMAQSTGSGQPISLTTTSGGNVTIAANGGGINGSGPVTIAAAGALAINGAVAGTETVSLTTTAGGISQTGTGTIKAATLRIDAAGAAALDGTAHTVTTLEVANSSGLALVNTGALAIAGISSGSGAVVVEASGAIAINGAVSSAGPVSLTTGAGGISQTTAGTITAPALRIAAAGAADLNETAHGVAELEVTNSSGVEFKSAGALVIAGISSGAAATVEAGGTITINGAVSSANAGAIAIIAAGSGSDIALQGPVESAGAGPITLTAGGSVSQNSSGLLSGGALTLAAGGSIALDMGNAMECLWVAGGPVRFSNAKDLSIGESGVAAPGIVSANAPVTVTVDGAMTLEQAVNAGTGDITLEALAGITQKADISGATVILHKTGSAGGILQAAGSITATTLLEIKGSYADPLELPGPNHAAKIKVADAGGSLALVNELQAAGVLELDTIKGGDRVAITENGGSINALDTITAKTVQLTAKNDIAIRGTNSFDQAEDLIFVLGGAMDCANDLEAGNSIAIRPFEQAQAVYVSPAAGGSPGVSIPQKIFDSLKAPRVTVGGLDKDGNEHTGDVYIGSLSNGSSGGYDIEISSASNMYVDGVVKVTGAADPAIRTIKLSARRLAMKSRAAILPDAALGSNIHIILEINGFAAGSDNSIDAGKPGLIQLYPRGAAEGHPAPGDIQYGDADVPAIMPNSPYVYYSSLWTVLRSDRYIVGHENYNGNIYVSGVASANYILEAKNNASNKNSDYYIYFYGKYKSNDKRLDLQSTAIILFNTAEINVGSAEELVIEKNLIVRSSGVSPEDAETSITGSGIIRINSIEGQDGVSFSIDNTGGNAAGSRASINGPIAMQGAFVYRGALLSIGSGDPGGPRTSVAAPVMLFDTPRIAGNIAFDGDVGFAQSRTELAGHIENKKILRAGSDQQVIFGGNYAGIPGSLLTGTGSSTEIHFRRDAEFLGAPGTGYEDKDGSWLVFSGGEIQRFNSGGNALGNIRIDKDGGDLRLVGNDVLQRGDARLNIANGLLNLTEAGSGGTELKGWTLGGSGGASGAGNFAGLGGTLELANSSGTGAELRALDIALHDNLALAANRGGTNTIAALGNIAIGKNNNNKNFGTSSLAMIPGSAAARTQVASEAAFHKLIVLRNAKLAGDITVTEMQLGSPGQTSGITLDGGSSVIRVLGNWTSHVADVDSKGIAGAFLYGTSVVIFDPAANPAVITGGSAWHTLVCETPGTVLQFDNYPSRHYVAHALRVRGAANGKGHIVLTRRDDTPGQPNRKPPGTSWPDLPLQAGDHEKYWDLVIPSGANGSNGITMDLENVIIAYSNANLRVPIPPREKGVLAYPFYHRAHELPPGAYPGEDYGNYSYYNINWVALYSFVYAFTEDADGNGRIDRIRAQAAYELNAAMSGAFDQFSMKVTKNNETEEWIRVKGYGPVPGFPDSIYLRLEEHDYADGGAAGLAVSIVNNESLRDLATGLSPVKNPESEDGPLLTTDTVFPRVSYALMPPNSNEAFVQFSEAVDPASMQFVYPEGRKPTRIAPVDPAKSAEFVLGFAGGGYAVDVLASGSGFSLSGIRDRAAYARDKNEDDPGCPPPKYPVDWKYSDYVAVPGNPPDIARGYRIIPGDLGASFSGTVLPPPNGLPVLPGETFSHRVTDLLVSDDPVRYFAKPVWAMNTQNTVGADQGAHVVRIFNGGEYLEDKDITLEIHVNSPALNAYVPKLIFGSAIPDAARAGYSPVDPDFGVPHGIAGLWLPYFESRAYGGQPPRENAYAFSNIVAQAYASAYTLGHSSGGTNGNFVFSLKKNDSAYGYAGISMLEFFLLLAPNTANPASDYLYLGRLGKGSPWYRHVEPFKFELHNITRQRGGVTILNNVIKPSTGESVYVDYVLPRNGPVAIQVFTLDGNLVKVLARESKAAGEYRAAWDGKNNGGREVARGLYFIRVVAPDVDEIRKVMVAR
jgi:hypothetical protein